MSRKIPKYHKAARISLSIHSFEYKPIVDFINYLQEVTKDLIDPVIASDSYFDYHNGEYFISHHIPMTDKEKEYVDKKEKQRLARNKISNEKKLALKKEEELAQLKKLIAKYPDQI